MCIAVSVDVPHYLLPEAPEGIQTQILKKVYKHVKVNRDILLVVFVKYAYILILFI